jgi:hypothetical protein
MDQIRNPENSRLFDGTAGRWSNLATCRPSTNPMQPQSSISPDTAELWLHLTLFCETVG